MRKLLISTAAVLAAICAAPAAAEAPSVTLAVSGASGGPTGSITHVTYGQAVEVAGNVSSGRAGERVTVIINEYGGDLSDKPITKTVEVTTEDGGLFSVMHRPTIRTGYQAQWGQIKSRRNPFAHVRPKVTLRALRPRVGQFLIRVSARRTYAGRRVQLQRRVGSRWVTIRRPRLGPRMAVSFRARLPRGISRLRVNVAPRPGYIRGFSSIVIVSR